jgi:hypothetical protein
VRITVVAGRSIRFPLPRRAGGAWRVGRFWSTNPTEVTVADTEEYPRCVLVGVAHTLAAGGLEPRPDPTCIGRASYRALLADPRLTVEIIEP